MTRERQIIEAAEQYASDTWDKTNLQGGILRVVKEAYVKAFNGGAGWADEHPKSPWRPIRPDNLPPMGSDFVLMSDEGVTKLVHIPELVSYIPPIQNCEGTCWTHWMLVPKLEKE